MAQIIGDTEGAIGYVDLADSDAASLQQALIENADGEFVGPTLDGAAAAVENAEVAPDLTYNPLNASGAGVYPITAPTYIIVTKTQSADTGETVKGWINYVLTGGQDWRTTRASRRCRPAWRTRRSPNSTSSPSARHTRRMANLTAPEHDRAAGT